jgi:hypothetical protein
LRCIYRRGDRRREGWAGKERRKQEKRRERRRDKRKMM